MRDFFSRYWQLALAGLGWMPAIWAFIKWAADTRGRYDAISATLTEIGGWRGMIAFLISPPPWFPLLASVVSIALIVWHFKRNAPTSKQKASGNGNLEKSLSYLSQRDSDLGYAIMTMARKSAWGRWYAAQHLVNSSVPAGDNYLFQIASSIIWRNILDGEIQVKGRRPGQLDYEEIPRTHWRSSSFCFVSNDNIMWKMVIAPTGKAYPFDSGSAICCV